MILAYCKNGSISAEVYLANVAIWRSLKINAAKFSVRVFALWKPFGVVISLEIIELAMMIMWLHRCSTIGCLG